VCSARARRGIAIFVANQIKIQIAHSIHTPSTPFAPLVDGPQVGLVAVEAVLCLVVLGGLG
jgi:hypothetical protein